MIDEKDIYYQKKIIEMVSEIKNPRELRMIFGFVRGAYENEGRKAVQTNE